MIGQHAPCVLQEFRSRPRKRENLVPLAQGPVVPAHHRIHDERHCVIEHKRGFEHPGHHSPVYVYAQRIISTQNLRVAHVPAHQVCLQGGEVLRNIVVQRDYAVSRLEAHLDGKLVGIYAGLRVGDIGGAPYAQNGAVRDDGEYEVEQHAARHHQQPLPRRVAAELPRLGLALKLLGVHGLVHHSGNLAVAAEREPAYSEFRLAHAEAQQGLALHIEEKVEFLHLDAEELCEYEMAEFVYYDQQREGKYNLKCL